MKSRFSYWLHIVVQVKDSFKICQSIAEVVQFECVCCCWSIVLDLVKSKGKDSFIQISLKERELYCKCSGNKKYDWSRSPNSKGHSYIFICDCLQSWIFLLAGFTPKRDQKQLFKITVITYIQSLNYKSFLVKLWFENANLMV